jgi:hypothetical protein
MDFGAAVAIAVGILFGLIGCGMDIKAGLRDIADALRNKK